MNPDDFLLSGLGPAGPALGAWLRSLAEQSRAEERQRNMANAVKHAPTGPAPLPTDRPTLPVGREDMILDGGMEGPPPRLTVPDETRPMPQQPVRFLRRPDGQPAFTFTVDPSSGEAVRWIPPGAGQGQSIDPAMRRRLAQNPGAPPPGQLPPRSVAAPPPTALDLQADRVEQSREADRATALQRLQELGLSPEELERHFAEMTKSTNPGDALRRLMEARSAR